MKSTPITAPTLYRGMIIKPNGDGSFDLINPDTGHWATFATQRHAKWSSSVLANLNMRFMQHRPLKRVPEVPCQT
jgi:hypothetical protein